MEAYFLPGKNFEFSWLDMMCTWNLQTSTGGVNNFSPQQLQST